MSDKTVMDETLYDVRTIRRRLASGLIKENELKTWLDGLEDCSSLVEVSNVRMMATTISPRTSDDLEEER